jgi:hypothetical protein
MDNQPAISHSRYTPARLLPWVFVLLVLVFIGFIRVLLLDMPLERDEGEYAYAGQLMLQGIPPYELAYNMKLPETYLAYALGMAVFGETSAGVHLTLLAANALTIVFVFLLARKLFGVMAGLVACASYGVMSVSVPVLGMAAHATQFVILFAVPATLLLSKADKDKRAGTLFFSGLLYGLAFLVKQQGICFCVFGWLFLFAQAARNKAMFSAGFAKQGFVFGAGMVLPFALTCLWLAAASVFPQFWFWTFTYARSYATALTFAEGWSHLTAYLHGTFAAAAGFWLVLVAGLPAALIVKSIRGQTLFATAFGVFSFLGVAIGLYFRPHYFVLALPAFAVLLGAAVAGLRQALRLPIVENVFRTLPLIFFALAPAWFVYYQSPFYFQLSPIQSCHFNYPLDPFAETAALADWVRTNSAPDARVAVIGSEPEIYFYARRHSATSFIYTYALMEAQPNALKMQREMISEIESNRPEYLVWVGYGTSWEVRPDSPSAIFDWFGRYANDFYEPVARNGGPMTGDLRPAFVQELVLYRLKAVPQNRSER